ncbi:MAG: hypothetical protein IM658_05475 [Phenylobacterium sp.]|uniref:hypothetical protein n=1 Tax=Phenylobacterium sp. TaxID=1871053 RepID=UPI0025EEDE3B|nr:hypothetical protein [Phenylobacterium sp.]MCA3712715.1 hypothetical protein [Phenylobacterium sp.]MCA3739199.1 hypothetical protein [Phenylobacterium sp.]MCA3747490.1 hypothetical protein [Phenylobacterium sp.]MCA3751328.1 hypothetical protein [Phenylobacterium sp.]MCA6238231.1 hypothetical protein [Phenylobacterium sp.]
MPMTHARIDARLRRIARRHGYVLRRSRRGFSLDNLGGYRIVDPYLNACVAGARFDLEPADVEDWFAWLTSGSEPAAA